MSSKQSREIAAYFKRWDLEIASVFKAGIAREIGYQGVGTSGWVSIPKETFRRRVPRDVAFEVARAIHFCDGDRSALRLLKLRLSDKRRLNALAQKCTLEIRLKIYRWLWEQIDANRQKEKVATNALEIRKFRSEIVRLSKERARVGSFHLSWSFLRDRSHDRGWTSHLKQELIRTILSEGKPRIISNKSRLVRKQIQLLKEMERVNQKTLRS